MKWSPSPGTGNHCSEQRRFQDIVVENVHLILVDRGFRNWRTLRVAVLEIAAIGNASVDQASWFRNRKKYFTTDSIFSTTVQHLSRILSQSYFLNFRIWFRHLLPLKKTIGIKVVKSWAAWNPSNNCLVCLNNLPSSLYDASWSFSDESSPEVPRSEPPINRERSPYASSLKINVQ